MTNETTTAITLKEATELYLEALKKFGKAERTLHTYRIDLAVLCKYWGEDTPLHKITLLSIGKFLKSDLLHSNKHSGKPRSEITVNKNVRVMRQFLTWAHEQKLIDSLAFPKSVPMGHTKLS